MKDINTAIGSVTATIMAGTTTKVPGWIAVRPKKLLCIQRAVSR